MDFASLFVPVLLALRFSFALLLGAAALHKMRDLARFRAALADYDVLPPGVARALAPVLAAAEAAVASVLAAGVAIPAAAAATAALMLAYASAMAVNVSRGRTDLDCGCMGPAARVPVSSALVVRNVVLAAAAASMALPAPDRAAHWIDVASAMAATLALAASWLAAERLLALAPRAAKLRGRVRVFEKPVPVPEFSGMSRLLERRP